MRGARGGPCSGVVALALGLGLSGPGVAAGQDGPVNPLAQRDPWSGTWRNEQLSVVLERHGQGWRGTIVMGADSMPCEARAAGERRLEGAFVVQGTRFPFQATLDGDALVLTSDGESYRLQRERPANPLGQGRPPQPANPLAGGASPGTPPGDGGKGDGLLGGDVPADWATWRHPLGFTLRHPPTWRPQETEAGLAFVAPDALKDAQGQPLELLLLNAVAAEGVRQPDQPEAVAFLDQQLQGTFPFLRRQAAPVVRTVGGRRVAELTWTGKNPLGRDIKAVAQLVIVDDQGILCLLVGDATRVGERLETARRLFGSMSKGKAQTDARLVGTWRHEKHTFSGTFSSTSIRTIELRADGTCLDHAQTLAGMDHKDSGGNQTGRTDVDSGGSARRGQWAGGGGKLLMSWADGGSEEYTIELSGSSLLLKSGQGQPRLYERVR